MLRLTNEGSIYWISVETEDLHLLVSIISGELIRLFGEYVRRVIFASFLFLFNGIIDARWENSVRNEATREPAIT